MYHNSNWGYRLKETKQSLSELWALLRNEEQKLGLNTLTLTEKDIFETILHLQSDNLNIDLNFIIKNCNYPRATFFRALKKLRKYNFIKITKDNEDGRKSIIEINQKFLR